MKTKSSRLDRAYDVRIIATFGDALFVQRLDGRYELHGGSAADHTAAKEWISNFRHEAVISQPAPVPGQMGLSGFAPSVSEYCSSLGSKAILRP